MKKKKSKASKSSNALFYVLIAAAAIVVVVSAYSLIGSNYYGSDYQKAMSAQTADKCATPEGYTDEAWQQHMSHHPDMYEECFK